MAKIIGRNLFAEEPQENIKPSKKPKIVGRNLFADEPEEGEEGRQLEAPEETKGFAGIAQDIGSQLKKFANPNLSKAQRNRLIGNGMPSNPFDKPPTEEVPGFAKQVANLPLEAIKFPLTGEAPRLTKNVYKSLEGAGNIPSSIASYIGRKGLISPEIGKNIHIPEHDMGLGKKQEGDLIAQHLIDFLPLTPKGFKAISGSNAPLIRAMNEHQGAANFEKYINEQLVNELKTNDPAKVRHKISEEEEALKNALQEHRQIPEENLSNRLPSPSGDEIVPQALHALEDVRFRTRQELGEGEPHGENAAKKIKAEEQKIYEGFSKEYDNLKAELKGKKIAVKNPLDVNEIREESGKQLGTHATTKQKEAYFQAALKNAEKTNETKIMDAAEYFSKYRTLTQEANKLKYKAKKHGLTDGERKTLKEQAKIKEEQAKFVEKQMKPRIGDKQFEKLQDINTRYSTEYAPLRDNTLAREIKKKGLLGKPGTDILHKISGDEKGQDIIRNIIHSNPEIIKDILSHQFSSHPERLLEPNRHLTNLLENDHPSLQSIKQLIKEQHEANTGISHAEKRAAEVKAEHERVEKAGKEDIAKQKRREKLSEEIKTRQEKIKRANELLAQKENVANITPKMQEEIERLTKSVKKNKGFIKKALKSGLQLSGLNSTTKYINKILSDLVE